MFCCPQQVVRSSYLYSGGDYSTAVKIFKAKISNKKTISFPKLFRAVSIFPFLKKLYKDFYFDEQSECVQRRLYLIENPMINVNNPQFCSTGSNVLGPSGWTP